MFELLITVFTVWLGIKAIGLMLKLTWGITKLAAGILIVLAFPALLGCLLFAGGILLLIPLAMIAIAAGIVKACV